MAAALNWIKGVGFEKIGSVEKELVEYVWRELEKIEGLPVLKVSEIIENLANELIYRHAIDELYYQDAIHIALSLFNKMDILLYWDFKYWEYTTSPVILNSSKGMIKVVTQLNGFRELAIITPEEF